MKVCLVGSSGGHLTHLYMLKPFWENKDRFWVTFDKEDARSLLDKEKMYPCYYPTNRSLKALLKNTKIAWEILQKEKPDLIISCGAAVAVPFFYLGKLFGAKLVYIEVFDRIDKPTVTGKMVYPVTDRFIVQWEEQKKVYPKAINIIHLASNTHPKQYAEDPIGTIMTNIYGCDNLLKLAVEKKARFLLASSVEIYGQGTAIPMNEEYCGYIDCNLARSGYNEAKRTCEALTQSYRSVFGVNAVIARFARVFGADKKHDTKAMSQFMDKAVLGEDIILKSKGQQRYSYCYIADAVSGLLKLLLDGQDGEAYNISNDDDGLTLGEYAEYIASLANLKVRYEIENNESVSKATFALLDTHKIKNIGWKPQYSVKDGLKRTYMIKKEQLTNVD